jgi:predicted deacylase
MHPDASPPETLPEPRFTQSETPATPDPHRPLPARVICAHKADQPGPTLIVVAGIHGNEPAGIRAAERIDQSLRNNNGLRIGSFFALRGNLPALAVSPEDPSNNPRYLHADLNRLFKPDDGVRTPDHDQRDAIRAELDRIAAESRGPVYLIDLHTTSSASPPFIALEDSLPARTFAERFALPLILGMEEDLQGLLMDEATARLGCVALTIEGGRHDDPEATNTLEAVIRIALESLGMLEPDPATDPTGLTREAAGRFAHHVYDVRHREPVTATPYAPNPAARPFTQVKAEHTKIAELPSGPLLAADSGILFMPNHQRDIRIGDDAYFVVRRVGRFWLRLSAFLRRRETIHRLLPALLPGVRRRPNHPHDLVIDPELAAVFRREIFHLLGYRLIRFSPTPGLRRPARARRAARITIHAGARILANLVRTGNTDKTHDERVTDWVVRRHALDSSDASQRPAHRE